ncbi:MAG: hypothetical protein EZS28_008093 [Streblomastix strix]|uniref:Uncharacterized protein n=1 Tax=Streblomastix strix TaxID=222440 RepID=A0A5J4WNH4_9EUKA|nr:MAG: hypothetical protein EZS28_008093 [Streblomastix strix]
MQWIKDDRIINKVKLILVDKINQQNEQEQQIQQQQQKQKQSEDEENEWKQYYFRTVKSRNKKYQLMKKEVEREKGVIRGRNEDNIEIRDEIELQIQKEIEKEEERKLYLLNRKNKQDITDKFIEMKEVSESMKEEKEQHEEKSGEVESFVDKEIEIQNQSITDDKDKKADIDVEQERESDAQQDSQIIRDIERDAEEESHNSHSDSWTAVGIIEKKQQEQEKEVNEEKQSNQEVKDDKDQVKIKILNLDITGKEREKGGLFDEAEQQAIFIFITITPSSVEPIEDSTWQYI